MELHERSSSIYGKTESQGEVDSGPSELPPPDLFDPVIEAYKKDIDRTLLITNLRLSVADRLAKFQDFMNFLGEIRGAALPPDMREKLFGKR